MSAYGPTWPHMSGYTWSHRYMAPHVVAHSYFPQDILRPIGPLAAGVQQGTQGLLFLLRCWDRGPPSWQPHGMITGSIPGLQAGPWVLVGTLLPSCFHDPRGSCSISTLQMENQGPKLISKAGRSGRGGRKAEPAQQRMPPGAQSRYTLA